MARCLLLRETKGENISGMKERQRNKLIFAPVAIEHYSCWYTKLYETCDWQQLSAMVDKSTEILR